MSKTQNPLTPDAELREWAHRPWSGGAEACDLAGRVVDLAFQLLEAREVLRRMRSAHLYHDDGRSVHPTSALAVDRRARACLPEHQEPGSE